MPNYVYDIPRANLPTQRTDWRPVFTASNVGKGAQLALKEEWLVLLEYSIRCTPACWALVGSFHGRFGTTLPEEKIQRCRLLVADAGRLGGIPSYIPPTPTTASVSGYVGTATMPPVRPGTSSSVSTVRHQDHGSSPPEPNDALSHPILEDYSGRNQLPCNGSRRKDLHLHLSTRMAVHAWDGNAWQTSGDSGQAAKPVATPAGAVHRWDGQSLGHVRQHREALRRQRR